MVTRYIGSGRQRDGGLAAVHRRDFHAHTTGGDWRHDATQTDMNPSLTVLNNLFNSTTVQGTLEKIADFLNTVGQGFVTIGDGYDSAGNDFTVGSIDTPTLKDAFDAAFLHARLTNGGIILVKAGTYRLSSTVTIPAGISVIGEVSGTLIISEGSEVPMFLISRSKKRFNISPDGIVSDNPLDKICFYNFMLADNLDGYASSGSPTMLTVPMIRVERGAHFSCEQITFLGRMGSLGAGPTFGRTKTNSAISVTTGSSDETVILIDKCTADGLKIFINFSTPGTNDKLSITNSKIRVFGTENTSTQTDISQQCFVTTISSGEISIMNNFLDANGNSSVLTSCILNVASGSPRAKIIANSGYSNTTLTHGSIINVVAGASIPAIVSGNNWNDQHLQNEWFITIGDGVLSTGDITGTDAFDKALQLISNNSLNATIIVNEGQFTVNGVTSGTNTTQLSIIGKRKTAYPVLVLNLTNSVTQDILGNNTLNLGQHVSGINFQAFSSSFHSITLPSIGFTEVKDCFFINVGVVFDELTIDTAAAVLKNCVFYQNGTFADNLSALLPPGNEITVDNCSFLGGGYAIAIGSFSSISYDGHVSLRSNPGIHFKSCVFDMDGDTITGNSPLGSSENRYITINESNATVSFRDCKIYAESDMITAASPIDVGLSTSFDRFVSISAKDILFDGCEISGPNQTWNDGSGDWLMPTIFVEPRRSFKFLNCKCVGALPVQVAGTNAFSGDYWGTASETAGVFIKDSMLIGYFNNSVTMTALSIELDVNSSPHALTNLGLSHAPVVEITGCTISNQNSGSDGFPARHISTVGAGFATGYYFIGAAQIYANGFSTFITNNIIDGSDVQDGGGVASFPNHGCLIVNLFNDSGGLGAPGSVNSNCIISNNIIRMNSIFDDASSSHFTAALFVQSPVMMVNNNNIVVYRPVVSTGTVVTHMYVKSNAGLGSTSDAMIQGNSFERKNTTITTFVYIDSASGSGMLVDNSFSSPTVDGSAISVIDNNTTNPWIIDRNRNQTKLAVLGGADGICAVSESAISTDFAVSAGNFGSINSAIYLNELHPPNYRIRFDYADTGTQMTFIWECSLNSILPPVAKIISATVIASSDTTFSTTGTFTFRLHSDIDTTGVTDTFDFTSVTTDVGTITVSDPEDYINSSKPVLTLKLLGNSSGINFVDIIAIGVTYRW